MLNFEDEFDKYKKEEEAEKFSEGDVLIECVVKKRVRFVRFWFFKLRRFYC